MKENLSADLDRFKTVLDIYGAKKDAWPESDLELMMGLLETSDVAKSLLRQEERFDALLEKENMALSAPSALLSRVLIDAEELNTGSLLKILWPFGSFWQPASGLILAAFVGAFIGLASPNVLDSGEDLLNDEPTLGVTLFDLEYENDSL